MHVQKIAWQLEGFECDRFLKIGETRAGFESQGYQTCEVKILAISVL